MRALRPALQPAHTRHAGDTMHDRPEHDGAMMNLTILMEAFPRGFICSPGGSKVAEQHTGEDGKEEDVELCRRACVSAER
jgi:hypothetical protein